MESILSSLPNLRIRQKVRDDDSVDQLHHFVTVYLFAFAGFLISLKELVGEPLDCWVNMSSWKHFQGHVNSYCWSHQMYRFPNYSDLAQTPYPLTAGASGPPSPSVGSEVDQDFGEINMYRWITVIFFIQALMFKIPELIWSECNEYSGTQIEKMVSMISGSTFEPKEKRDTVMATMAEFLETWLKIHRKPYFRIGSRMARLSKKILRHCLLCVGTNQGNYLSSLYLVIKFLFLLNVFLQFVLLTAFLDFDYWNYGPYAVSAFSSGSRNVHFPRVGLCHFNMRGEAYWVQCLFSINRLLDKIFVVEWFWLLGLLIVTGVNFIMWILRVLQTQLSVQFLKRYLMVIDTQGVVNLPELSRVFVMEYLGNDGIFVLRILATNTNDVALSELIQQIWNRFMEGKGLKVMKPGRSANLEDEAAAELNPMDTPTRLTVT